MPISDKGVSAHQRSLSPNKESQPSTCNSQAPAPRKKPAQAAAKKGKKGGGAEEDSVVVGAGALDLASPLPLPVDESVAAKSSPPSSAAAVPQAGAKKALHRAFDVFGSATGKKNGGENGGGMIV